jgi:hypothetical protein
MSLNNLPLWSCFVAITILSLFFLQLPDYDIDYISKYNLAMWTICILIYGGEYIYNKKVNQNGTLG